MWQAFTGTFEIMFFYGAALAALFGLLTLFKRYMRNRPVKKAPAQIAKRERLGFFGIIALGCLYYLFYYVPFQAMPNDIFKALFVVYCFYLIVQDKKSKERN